MKVAVSGASNKPHRYSYQAVMLLRKGAANNNHLKKTEKGLSKKYNFKMYNHMIQFYGLCKSC